MAVLLLSQASEIYILLKEANISLLQLSYYKSIAKLMFDTGNKTVAAKLFKNYLKTYQVFISIIHVLLVLITFICDLLGYLANLFSRIRVRVCKEVLQFLRNLSKNSFKK